MKIGIMQPYFFPYIGYWQLINAVDKFVVYDDVNFINRGWINRNNIYVNGRQKYINVYLNAASQNKKINKIGVLTDKTGICVSIIQQSYKSAPYFDDIFPLIRKIIINEEKNLAEFLCFSIREIANYLDIKTEIIMSSKIEKNNTLKGQDKIIDICKNLNATYYYNAIGGKELYSRDVFSSNGIELKFLQTDDIKYDRAGLLQNIQISIIDILMFNDRSQVKKMLMQFHLQ